jgi:Zn-dependent metalloprotease
VAVLSATGASRAADPSAAAQAEALERLRSESSVEPRVRFREGAPAFVAVKVRIPAAVADDPVASALDYLERYRALYRLEDPRGSLHLRRLARSGTETAVFFGQHFEGIPVFGTEIAVQLEKRAIRGTSGFYLTQAPPILPPKLRPDEAEKAAIALLGGSVERRGEIRLVLLAQRAVGEQGQPVRLAWRVPLAGTDGQGLASYWWVFVDAASGAPLEVFETTAYHAPNPRFDVEDGSSDETCGGIFGDSRPVWFDQTGPTSDYPGPSGDAFGDAARTFVNAHRVYDYFFNTFHRHGADGDDRRQEIVVHALLFRNAWVSEDCPDKVFLGRGFQSLDTLAHEIVHVIAAYLHGAGGFWVYGDWIEESLADTFGAFVEGDWLPGAGNRLLPGEAPRCDGPGAATLPPGTARSMSDPPLCGEDDHATGSGSVSSQGPLNKAAYWITEGRIGPGLAIPGLGRTKAERLYYDALTRRLPLRVEEIDLRDALVEQARSYAEDGLYRFVPRDACSVMNAFAAVGIGTADLDCDGIDDGVEDRDGDGVPDETDLCPDDFDPHQLDRDGDETGDACDDDRDGDGLANEMDVCPGIPGPDQTDTDGDGIGDACDDRDGDSLIDLADNCPDHRNPGQENTDGLPDGGDACDDDDDEDGLLDVVDNCITVVNFKQEDADGDGVGDVCDNCPGDPNPFQENSDGAMDGGDACDADDDGDGIVDESDNCQTLLNPQQIDIDGNGIGLACDPEEALLLLGLPGLEGLLRFDGLDRRARIPIAPCLADCPDWLAPELATRVEVSLPFEAAVRIVDDGGFEVASGRFTPQGAEGANVLRFRPRADAFFRPPAAAGLGSLAASDAPALRFREYFLEISPPEGLNGPTEIPVRLRVESREEPIPGFVPGLRARPWRFWAKAASWPIETVVLGAQAYGRATLLQLFSGPPGKPDASLTLARALAAAKLSCRSGVDCSAIASSLTEADVRLSRYPGTLPFGVSPGSDEWKGLVKLAKQIARWRR